MLKNRQIFSSKIITRNSLTSSLSFISFHTPCRIVSLANVWELRTEDEKREERGKEGKGSDGRKGCLDKDTIVRMGIARLPGSALSTHLDNERTTQLVKTPAGMIPPLAAKLAKMRRETRDLIGLEIEWLDIFLRGEQVYAVQLIDTCSLRDFTKSKICEWPKSNDYRNEKKESINVRTRKKYFFLASVRMYKVE